MSLVIRKKRRMGRGVAMVGAGMSKFGVHPGENTRELFVQAYNEMRESVDKGLDPNDIDGLWVGNVNSELWESQSTIGVTCADWLGLVPRPAAKIEDACASGQVAIREAVVGIASGLYDVAVAGGTEKMTDLTTTESTLVLACSSDTLYECSAGFTFPGLYAAIATAHMHEYGTTREDLMHVAIKNHQNGALNPKAHFPISIKGFMELRQQKCQQRGQPVPDWADELEFLRDPAFNPMVAWPLALFDCSPITDGAACVLLVAEEIAKEFTDDPIYIIGTGQSSGRPLHGRETLTSLPATKVAAEQAYEMAGVGPQDIKIAEIHDCFTIAEIMAIADLGFFKEGKEAATAAVEGKTALNGVKPVNTSGGLKAKGHPVGASGGGMAVEIFHQMRGEAGPRQVPDIDVNLALSHNIGAHGTSCVVQVYERR
ncbi:MAG: beta-ketoacyl synthase N-terminal-like domain-containing protein [Chloroflexota bacterium]